MRKALILFVILILFVAAAGTYFYVKKIMARDYGVCFGEACFMAEVAMSEEKMKEGLRNRESLDKDKGMLFVLSKEEAFEVSMKDVKVPLDIIWLDKDKKIIDIKTVAPCLRDKCPVYRPETPAQYVFEVNSGIADSLGLKKGVQAKFVTLTK